MFENLGKKMQDLFRRMKDRGKLTESDVNEILREVRVALLEADVNFKVVREFIAAIKDKAVGTEVLESLTPDQQVVKIVHDQLVEMLGTQAEPLKYSPKPPTVLLLCGLQGSGKTTTAAKLGVYYRSQGRNPLLVACDLQRPAAVKQLQILGEQTKAPVFVMPGETDPVKVAQAAVAWAPKNGCDIVILDTAGRLHVDEGLMDQVRRVKSTTNPSETLLVLDAMTGQDAVRVAEEFNKALDVDGFIMSKLDGDTRGGAAISIRAVVGKPIKMCGISEKNDGLEIFHPDRMAGRILGMGDVLTSIETVLSSIDQDAMADSMKRMQDGGGFSMNEFLAQLRQVQKLPIKRLMSMIPGLPAMPEGFDVNPKDLKRIEAIILSMTALERVRPDLINGSRRRRIAKGSGTTVQQVNELMAQYAQIKKMFKKVNVMQKDAKQLKRQVNKGMPRFPFGK